MQMNAIQEIFEKMKLMNRDTFSSYESFNVHNSSQVGSDIMASLMHPKSNYAKFFQQKWNTN